MKLTEDLNKYHNKSQIDNYYVYSHDINGELKPFLRIDEYDGRYKSVNDFNNPTKYSKESNSRIFLNRIFYEENHKKQHNKIYLHDRILSICYQTKNKYLWDNENIIFAIRCNICQKYLTIDCFTKRTVSYCKKCHSEDTLKRLELLKENNPKEYKLRQSRAYKAKMSKLENIKQNDIKEYDIIIKKRNDYYTGKRRKLKIEYPEQYAEYLEMSRIKNKKYNEELKKNDYEGWVKWKEYWAKHRKDWYKSIKKDPDKYQALKEYRKNWIKKSKTLIKN